MKRLDRMLPWRLARHLERLDRVLELVTQAAHERALTVRSLKDEVGELREQLRQLAESPAMLRYKEAEEQLEGIRGGSLIPPYES